MPREIDPTCLRQDEPSTYVQDKDLAHAMAARSTVAERAAVLAAGTQKHGAVAANLRDIAHFQAESVRVGREEERINAGRRRRVHIRMDLPDYGLVSHVTTLIENAGRPGQMYDNRIATYDATDPGVPSALDTIRAMTGAPDWVEAAPKWPEYVGRPDITTRETPTDFGVILQEVRRPSHNRQNGDFDAVEVFVVKPGEKFTFQDRERMYMLQRPMSRPDYEVPLYQRAVQETDGASLTYINVEINERALQDETRDVRGNWFVDGSLNPHYAHKDETPLQVKGSLDKLLAVEFRVAEFYAMLDGRIDTPDDLKEFIKTARTAKAQSEQRQKRRNELWREKRQQLWDSISDMELKRQEILPLQFYYDDIDIKILHYATSGNLFSPGDKYISA